MNSENQPTVGRDASQGRLADDIRREIATGILKPHARLRSEKALAKDYGVGVQAVRQAIKTLREEGRIYCKPRSGAYVADPQNTPTPLAQAPSEEGFHPFDLLHRQERRLTFLALGWNRQNKGMWERICRAASTAIPRTTIQPVFPTNNEEFKRARETCDVYVTSTSDTGIYQDNPDAPQRLTHDDLDGLPLPRRYLDAVRMNGSFVGMPLSATLLVGGINNRVVNENNCQELLAAPSWDATLPLLARLRAAQPHLAGINFHSGLTLNLFHYLTLVGGRLVAGQPPTLRFDTPECRAALKAFEFYRASLLPDLHHPNRYLAPESCITYLDYTYMVARRPAFLDFTPWLLPLGRNGSYMEGLNVAVISAGTIYPEESRQFLRYLVSDTVQQDLANQTCEHPVSSAIAAPFHGYPAPWQRVLEAARERSELFFDHIPGYFEFLYRVFVPYAERLFHGDIDSDTFMRQVSERGAEHFGVLNQDATSPNEQTLGRELAQR